jgi:hypothetical protein
MDELSSVSISCRFFFSICVESKVSATYFGIIDINVPDPWRFGMDPVLIPNPYHWMTDPALFFSGFQETNKK